MVETFQDLQTELQTEVSAMVLPESLETIMVPPESSEDTTLTVLLELLVVITAELLVETTAELLVEITAPESLEENTAESLEETISAHLPESLVEITLAQGHLSSVEASIAQQEPRSGLTEDMCQILCTVEWKGSTINMPHHLP